MANPSSLFAVGSVVVNFGQIAKVVGLFKSASGLPSDQDGWPILKGIGFDGKPRGGKWVADPSKCEATSSHVDPIYWRKGRDNGSVV